MSKTIKIEKGIPVPVKIAGTKYPLKDMEIGDSIPVFAKDIIIFRNMLTKISKKLGVKFITRKVDEGYRCWRVEK